MDQEPLSAPDAASEGAAPSTGERHATGEADAAAQQAEDERLKLREYNRKKQANYRLKMKRKIQDVAEKLDHQHKRRKQLWLFRTTLLTRIKVSTQALDEMATGTAGTAAGTGGQRSKEGSAHPDAATAHAGHASVTVHQQATAPGAQAQTVTHASPAQGVATATTAAGAGAVGPAQQPPVLQSPPQHSPAAVTSVTVHPRGHALGYEAAGRAADERGIYDYAYSASLSFEEVLPLLPVAVAGVSHRSSPRTSARSASPHAAPLSPSLSASAPLTTGDLPGAGTSSGAGSASRRPSVTASVPGMPSGADFSEQIIVRNAVRFIESSRYGPAMTAANTCWFVQYPYEVAQGLRMSHSTAPGSTGRFFALVLVLWTMTAESAYLMCLEELLDRQKGGAALVATRSPSSGQPKRVPQPQSRTPQHAHPEDSRKAAPESPSAAGAPDMRLLRKYGVTCGERQRWQIAAAVTTVLAPVLRRYRSLLAYEQWRHICILVCSLQVFAAGNHTALPRSQLHLMALIL